MRGTRKASSTKTSEKKFASQVKNCFLFDEDELSNDGNDTINSTSSTQMYKASEFCTDKPYRLALYVHPSTRRKVDPSDSKILANLTQMRQNQDKENINKPKRGKKTAASKENDNVTLFDDENDSTKCEGKTILQKKGRKLDEKTADGEKPSKIQKKGILSYVNVNESVPKKVENEELCEHFKEELSLPKTKQKRVRRAYKKKTKVVNTSQKSDEEDSESEVEKEKEKEEKKIKKSTKSKVKKEETNEDEEFKKWADSVNSDFEEIDKFELSITYD